MRTPRRQDHALKRISGVPPQCDAKHMYGPDLSSRSAARPDLRRLRGFSCAFPALCRMAPGKHLKNDWTPSIMRMGGRVTQGKRAAWELRRLLPTAPYRGVSRKLNTFDHLMKRNEKSRKKENQPEPLVDGSVIRTDHSSTFPLRQIL